MPSGVFSLKQVNQALQQGAWTNQKPLNVDYLVVAGGGGGGAQSGGGGGAGGLLQGNIPVSSGSAITVTVGSGGTGTAYNVSPNAGGNGNNSVFGSLLSYGGGGGGQDGSASNAPAPSGGSGGGGGMRSGVGGQGVAGQGNAGGTSQFQVYASSGGGGAGTKGIDQTYSATASSNGPGNGGAGVASDISGTRTTYAGGGGGGVYVATGNFGPGFGGAGGGGNGARSPSTSLATAGTANTGGGGGGGGSSTSDAYSSGANGGSGIVILSYPDIYQAAASTTGSPTVSTSGSGSMSFNGSNQYLLYNAQSAFAFGTGDFTIEFFVRFVDTNAGFPIDFRPSGGSSDAPVIYISVNTLRYYVSVDRITSGTLTAGVWYHVAVARSGTSTKMFIDGSQVGSTFTDTTNYTVGSGRPAIGSNGATLVSSLLNGYLSNFRIVKGTALYTSNFTPPTSPLTAVSNTSFLLNTVSGAVTADASGNGIAPGSGSQTVGWNQLSPFATGLGYKNRVYTWTSSGSITF